MATAAEKKLAYEQWKERCKQVQSFTDTSLMRKETPIEKESVFVGCNPIMLHSASITFPTSCSFVTRLLVR